MKPRFSVPLWTLLVFSALLKNAQVHCNTPGKVTDLRVNETTTSSIVLVWTKPEGNISFYKVLWKDGRQNVTKTDTKIADLTAGGRYDINVTAVAYDNETQGETVSITAYTQPEVVKNLTVTEIRTSSVLLNWTEPQGERSFYRVEWTNGTATWNKNVTETELNVTELTPGVGYSFTVIAVAGDNQTESEKAKISQHTKPSTIEKPSYNTSTSSISLNWTSPPGGVLKYIVKWQNGGTTASQSSENTSATLADLIPGTEYTIRVTALAGDEKTYGDPFTFSVFTKPALVKNLNVTSVTTTSISLIWTKPDGNVTWYIIQLIYNGHISEDITNETLFTIENLNPGCKYDITVSAAAGSLSNKGEGNLISTFTMPKAVTNLTVENVTTTAIKLAWFRQCDHQSSYSYLVIARLNDTVVKNESAANETYTFNKLVPGEQYNFSVFTVVAGVKSTEESTQSYTRPAKPVNINGTTGTHNLNIDWILPEGRVDHYVVDISNENLNFSSSGKTDNTTANFTNLSPGRLYVFTVTAVAGNFSNKSESVSSATVPTPPGSIIFRHRTNSSLQLEWATPDKMNGAPNISYNITYQPKDGDKQNKVSNVNDTELSQLLSGTSYNITIVTVGPQNLMSTVVHNSSFTLPNPVMNLVASPESTASIKVSWSYPLGVRPYYTYLLETYNDTGARINSTTITDNSTSVFNLEPGSKYNVSVRTIAAEGSESSVEQTFNYTMPKAVTNLTVENVTKASIKLTWLRQSDHKSSYSYLVIASLADKVVVNDSTKNETYIFNSLVPGEQYMLSVFTVVAGVKSTEESTQSYTKPEAVQNITAIGTTTELSVSWKLVSGRVSTYSVLLLNNTLLVNRTDVSNATTNITFLSLIPGVIYSVQLVTRSGPHETNSSIVHNATFPNPPGPITVESQTTNSINFTWPLPVDMNHKEYNFTVTTNGSFVIENNWHQLSDLQSGSPYRISVVTVGVMGYKSTPVTSENYTRPYPVTNLTQTEITTNSVTLVWEQLESKITYSYKVQVANESSHTFEKVNVTVTNITISKLRSGSNFSFTVTTLTADGTKAQPVTVSYFTRPHSISGLGAETLNTTAIRLNWMKPEDYRADYSYLVETQGCSSQNKTLAGETIVMSELTPGTNCTFCVSVMAANGIKGVTSCTSQYTKPETVQPNVSSQGSNNSIWVTWTKPHGNVEAYYVDLNGTIVHLDPMNTSQKFENLCAGKAYSAILTTGSGPFNESSGPITNATFPNPPGPVEILNQKTTSIKIRWGEAPRMNRANFFYQLIYTPSMEVNPINISDTNYNLTSLSSGTSYNICVVTVGELDFTSQRVCSYMVTTRPLNVQDLMAAPDEKSIRLTWTEPTGYKEGYKYNVTWNPVGEGTDNSTKLAETMYNVTKLVPGSCYNFSVTTETSDGTSGEPQRISNCTNASPVTNLTYKNQSKSNEKLTILILSWYKPDGEYTGFQILVNGTQILVNRTASNTACYNCYSYTVNNLHPYTKYNVTVKTQSHGQPSIPVNLECMTGITNPPIPVNATEKVILTERLHNGFTIMINPSLFIESNGPIMYVGVLVASSDATSNLMEYLRKTYNDWGKNDIKGYLATVTKRQQPLQRNNQDHLTITVGNNSKWEGYTNGPLTHNTKYRYAIVLFTDLSLNGTLVNSDDSLFAVLDSVVIELPQDPAVIETAIAATLGVFCILFISLIGFIIYWKRVAKKESPDIQIQSIRAKVSVAVSVDDYEAYFKKQKADSNCGFAEEFEDLKVVGTGQAKLHALSLENKPKNRYNNVLPYDSSRVKLSIIHGSPFDDYINANYMPGYNSRKEFIAAQGPLPTTVNDFWRMIWEKNVQTLVMLTRCNEQGRVKCEQYWSASTMHCENITVTTTSQIALEDWTIRDFDIKNVKTAETRSVRQFHFTAWPDHGVPETTELLISFRHLVREHMDQYSRHSPTVVHCSAGVGRTGTFIAIDRLIFQIERENTVDVYGIVHDLRMHRPLMVQTEDQYVFLNQCALDIIRSRTGTNVDLIYQNTAALSIYENVERKKGFP